MRIFFVICAALLSAGRASALEPVPDPSATPAIAASPAPETLASPAPKPDPSPLPELIPASEAGVKMEVVHGVPPIETLTLATEELPIQAQPVAAGGFRISVRLSGTFIQKQDALLLGTIPLSVAEKDGAFETWVPVESDETVVQLRAVDIRGTVRSETLRIHFPEFQAFLKRLLERNKDRVAFLASLGPTYLSYSQTRIGEFTSFGMTLKVSALKPIPGSRWDVGASGFVTALPFGTHLPDASLRFLGLNLRAGYSIPGVSEPWKVSVLGGLYYTTTFVTGDRFGFKNMAGPQIFPTGRRFFSRGDSVSGYLKLSPVSDSFSFHSLANREVAAGMAWVRPIRGGRSLSLSVDLANIRVVSEISTVSVTSASLGLGFGF